MCDELIQRAGRYVDAFLAAEILSRGDDGDCPYLPDRQACSEGFSVADEFDPAIYRALMDRGFRRSGRVIYRPVCRGCSSCIPMRVPVATFSATQSMRRVWRGNADVRVVIGDGAPSEEKYAIYAHYQSEHHDGTMSGDMDSFADFCYRSPLPQLELCYYAGNRLIGASILDVVPGALSSVYMYFDPREAKRSLGTYSILWELAYCRAEGFAYYYLGYWVPGSRTMDYKARFRPAEILGDTGWQLAPTAPQQENPRTRHS
ncbi:MAG: arginyltransferase [Phycisphaerales bacterium]|nr:arginyltransferase [Phycisphaerales bacterium]